ncbi:hypothetical protein [Sphingomonas sp. MMS24-J13]|uniref:hypothetical protein n=1 Tax=Sphingomonas sp. MMS24-J13 TaxID=3238686 RepID=UPI00384DB22C
MVDHRKLMSFSQPLAGFGRVVATAQVTGEEYLALASDQGDRVMVALRTDPGQLILNYQVGEDWHEEYTHVSVELEQGQVVAIAIDIGPEAWSFELVGQERFVYHSPVAGSRMSYAEGGAIGDGSTSTMARLGSRLPFCPRRVLCCSAAQPSFRCECYPIRVFSVGPAALFACLV